MISIIKCLITIIIRSIVIVIVIVSRSGASNRCN